MSTYQQLFKGKIEPSDSKLFWHYTDAPGLLGILQSQQLWATAPTSLNDMSEIHYGRALFEKTWAQIQSEYSSKQRDRVDGTIKPYLADWGDGNVFILSTSLNSDSLNQWHHYSHSGGFALGLRGDHLAPSQLTDQKKKWSINSPRFPIAMAGWFEVIYDPKVQREAIVSLIQYIANPPHLEEFDRLARLIFTWTSLYTLICCLKDPRFSAEEEVRYLASMSTDEDAEDYRVIDGRVSPFVRLRPAQLNPSRTHFEVNEEPLPIEEVVIGPGNPKEATSVLRRILNNYGHGDTVIRRSDAPLR